MLVRGGFPIEFSSRREATNYGVNKQQYSGGARRDEAGSGRAVSPEGREAQTDVQVSGVREIVGFIFELGSCL